MSGRLSAVDAISPAFHRMKDQLFAPFRFRYWMRMAVVCLLTGETTGGGGGGGGFNGLQMGPTHDGGKRLEFLGLANWPSHISPELLVWVALGILALVMFGLLMIYVASVFRFILFDAVLNNRCDLGEGWRRWQREGTSFFLWQIGFALASVAALGLLLGGPCYAAWRMGYFQHPDKHFIVLILGGATLLAVFIGAVILLALVSVFSKDFVVPIMALEGKGVMDAWRQALPVMSREKGQFSIYIVMKILLAFGAALMFGIADFFVVLMVLIPLGILGVAVYFIAQAAGLGWNPLTVSMVIIAGGAALFVLLYLISLVSLPAMVFFEAYSLHFYGARYEPLGRALSPPPPPPVPAPGMVPAPIV
jgi:MFS family permease